MFSMVLIASALMLTATSCEKETGPIPTAQTIECKAGDRPTITFSAGADWHLSSDAVWCKFITSAGEQNEISGNAGTHTITMKISDENNGNNWSTANITMKMGEKRGVIATLKRHPSELYLKLYDITDTPQKEIKLGYIDWIPFRLEANFRFAATEIPDWIEIGHKTTDGMVIDNSITGVPGEQTEAYARIVNNGERERYKIGKDEGYVIRLSDESGAHTFEFPIIYEGMGSDKITFEGPTDHIYGWEVSLDGKELHQGGYTFSNSLDFTITAQDDNYMVICIDKNIKQGIPSYKVYEEGDEECWMKFARDTDDRSSLTIAIDESDSMRHGAIMVVPMKIWNTIRGDIDSYIFDTDASSGIELPVIHNDYQKYVIMEFTQRDLNKEATMYIYHSITTLEIEAVKIEDATLVEKYGTENIYSCQFVSPIEGKRPGIIIDPHITDWTTDSYEARNASAEVWYNGENLKISDDEYYIGENKDEALALHLWGPKANYTDDVRIVFKVNGEAKKLLVVTPPTK